MRHCRLRVYAINQGQQLDGEHDRGAIMEVLCERAMKGELLIYDNGRTLANAEDLRRVLEQPLAQSLEGLAARALLMP